MQHQRFLLIKSATSLSKQIWFYSGLVTHPIKRELISHEEKVDMQEKQPNTNTGKVEHLDKNEING